ncbi:MAG: RCC1 domain-containing protein [Gemmatimonadaceae bacterium]
MRKARERSLPGLDFSGWAALLTTFAVTVRVAGASSVVHLLLVAALVFAQGAPDTSHVVGPMRFRWLSAGEHFTCALSRDGHTWCWGANYLGQLGTTAAPNVCGDGLVSRGSCSRVPVSVSGDVRFASITAGRTHACGIDLDGAAWCWGDDQDNQLGVGEAPERCALEGDGWKGLPPVPCSRTPLRVPSVAKYVAIAVGDGITCALDKHGHPWCWGGSRDHPEAVAVPLDEPVVLLSAAGQRACALTQGGLSRCWVWPDVLREGFTTPTGAQQCSAIAVAPAHACAIAAADSTVWCWGSDADAALGSHRGDHRKYVEWPPSPIAYRGRFLALATGPTRSCAVALDGALVCWGRLGAADADDQCLDSNGYAGSNDCTSTPVRREKLSHVLGVTLGDGHGCTILASGTAGCWGANEWAELGDGTRLAAESFHRIADRDRSGSPLVWTREHWPSGKFFLLVGAIFGGCVLILLALRLVPNVAMWPVAVGSRLATGSRRAAVPAVSPPIATVATERSTVGEISITMVGAGWALFLLAWVTRNSGSGHSDVDLGMAWLAILLAGAIGCALALTGGGLAFMRLRLAPADRAARVGFWFAILTLAMAVLGVAWLVKMD